MEGFFRGESEFLVQYGDILTDQDFGVLVRRHREQGALVTMLVHERAKSNSVVVLGPEGRVDGFLERPNESARVGVTSRWVNSGICVCSPEVLELIPEGRPADFPRDVFAPLVGTGRLYTVPLTGRRWAIDSVERLAEARAVLESGTWPVKPLRRGGGE